MLENPGRTSGRRYYTGERAIRREYDAAGQLAHEVLYFTRNLEIRDGKLVRWVYFAGERIAESPISLPAGGFPELPAETLTIAPPRLNLQHLLALLLLAFIALTMRVLATRPRRLLIGRLPWSDPGPVAATRGQGRASPSPGCAAARSPAVDGNWYDFGMILGVVDRNRRIRAN